MAEAPAAKEITLKKKKPLAPTFHRHIAKSKLVGQIWRIGDEVIVYKIVSSDQKSVFTVTEETIIHFE